MRVRLTPQEKEDIIWYRMTFHKRPPMKKFKKVDPMAYLFPTCSSGEMALVFNKPVGTIKTVVGKFR